MANEKEKLIVDGSFSPPPPGAPRQTTAAGSERATVQQIAAARANETVQPAFAPQPMTREAQIALIGLAAVERLEAQMGVRAPEAGPGAIPAIAGASAVEVPAPARESPSTSVAQPTAQVTPPPAPSPITSRFRKAGAVRPAIAPVLADGPESPDAGLAVGANPNAMPIAQTREDETVAEWQASQPEAPARYQPAASDSDTPSRGIPKAIADEGKRITGGFGDIAEAQYIPLDGAELGVIVKRLLTQISDQLDDDLRFSMAVTYPRVQAKVVVTINAYAQASVEIAKVAAYAKTPLAIAAERADEVVFVLAAAREEMTDAGESVTPPNAMRAEAGLEIPGKRYVDTPGGRMLVDVVGSPVGGGVTA